MSTSDTNIQNSNSQLERKIIQTLQNFSEECRKQKSVFKINYNSELSRNLISAFNDIFQNGFRLFPYHRYQEFLTQDISDLSFFTIISEEFPSLVTIKFIKSLTYSYNDRKRGYLWILLELSNRSIIYSIEQILKNQKILVCYEDDSILKQANILIEYIETLCSLNYMIEGELFSKFCLFENDLPNGKNIQQKEKEMNKIEEEEVQQFRPGEPTIPTSSQPYTIIITPCDQKKEQSENISFNQPIISPAHLIPKNNDNENKVKNRNIKYQQFIPKRNSWINISSNSNQQGNLQQCRESYLMKLNQNKDQLQITMNLIQKTGKTASQILFEKVFKEVVEGVQLKLDQVSGEDFRVSDQDFKCWSCFRQITVGILGNSRFCYYTCRYHCFECLSSNRMPIPWKAILEFDLNNYKVSQESYSEIEKLYELPILQINYNSPVVLKSSTLFEFLVQKRSLHLLYDTICDPTLLNNLLQDKINLCLKENLFSLQNLKEVAAGTLQKTLDEILKNLLKHVDNCKKCISKGEICKICKSQRVVYAYDIANINYCRKCMNLYHRKCFNKQICPSCID